MLIVIFIDYIIDIILPICIIKNCHPLPSPQSWIFSKLMYATSSPPPCSKCGMISYEILSCLTDLSMRYVVSIGLMSSLDKLTCQKPYGNVTCTNSKSNWSCVCELRLDSCIIATSKSRQRIYLPHLLVNFENHFHFIFNEHQGQFRTTRSYCRPNK